jgi:hypothetical protein
MNQSHYIDTYRQTNHDCPEGGGGYIPVGLVVLGQKGTVVRLLRV